MEKSRELNEFECGKIIGLKIAGRTHEAISRLLKIPKTTATDTIIRHANSNNGSNAKRSGRPSSMNGRRTLIESMPNTLSWSDTFPRVVYIPIFVYKLNLR
ncbi:11244_t:CDS:2 [Ambispora leptoticha]|uniref:11244_t:CDS:1 n=1 Tax=Ambispora leptoticha TaxID=144679 RepID=A0A9N8Z1H7_9GLOM|nr:11244_t:CDS:2 [Ambispora leptoticha]